MKALLVQPRIPWAHRIYLSQHSLPPLALGYLASVLCSRDIETEIIDLNVQIMSRSEFANFLVAGAFDLVGISTNTETANNAYLICQMAKEARMDTVTVVGGAHVTFRAEEALGTGVVDYVVIGEGEVTLAELVDYLQGRIPDRQSIDGLAFQANGRLHITQPRALMRNLDALPLPAHDILHLDQYTSPGVVVSSRGCPYQCIFCAAGAMAGGKFRVRNLDKVVAEIEVLTNNYDVRHLLFTDNTLTAAPQRVAELCRQMQAKAIDVKWFCESRVDLVNPQLLATMAESGCFSIQFGLESGNQMLLDAVEKKITLDQVHRAVQACIKVGIIPVLSYMVGHPDDTTDTIEGTKRFAREMMALGAVPLPSVMVPFPGTPLYERPADYGIEILATNWDDFQMNNATMNTRYLKAKEIQAHFFDIQQELMQQIRSNPFRFWWPQAIGTPSIGAAH